MATNEVKLVLDAEINPSMHLIMGELKRLATEFPDAVTKLFDRFFGSVDGFRESIFVKNYGPSAFGADEAVCTLEFSDTFLEFVAAVSALDGHANVIKDALHGPSTMIKITSDNRLSKTITQG